MTSVLRRLAGLLIAAVVLLLRRSWRVRVIGSLEAGRLHAFWHGDQLVLGGVLAGTGARVLISRSRDGEIAAGAARGLGFGTARGSSHRGAVAGSLAMVRQLRAGRAVALAVDGPRGPRHRCGESARRLARLAGAKLVAVGAAARRGLTLGSWDRLRVPAPFTRVQVVFGEPMEGEDLQAALDRVGSEASRLVDAKTTPPLIAGVLLVLLSLMPLACGFEREQARRALASPEPAVRAEALRQLGRGSDPAAGELIVGYLRDSSSRVRRSAVAALGALGLGSRERHRLIDRLHDGDLEVRLAAVRVLGDSKDARAEQPLLAVLDDASPIVRRAANLALRSLGLDGPAQARRRAAAQLEEHIKRLGHPDEQIAASAAQMLGLSGRPEALEPVLQRLATAARAPLLARELIGALGRLGGRRAVEELERRAAAGPPVLRAAAVEALGRLGGQERLLATLAGDGSPEVRRAALRSIEKIEEPGEATAAAVCARLMDEDETVARNAARLVRLRALRCAEADQAVHDAGRWRVVAELPGIRADLALGILARQRTAAYADEATRWVSPERWTELDDPAGPATDQPPPAAAASRSIDPARRAALERLLQRFRRQTDPGDEADLLLPPRTDLGELRDLLGAIAERGGGSRELLIQLALQAGPAKLRAATLAAAVTANASAIEVDRRLRAAVEGGLASSEPALHRAAAGGCALLGPAAGAAAERLLKSRDFELRRAGARCLVRSEGKRAVPRLLELLDEDPQPALVESLGRLGDARAVGPLLRRLVAEDLAAVDERLVIIEALDRLADSRAAAALEQELGHPDGRVRAAAARALAHAGRPSSAEALLACGEDFLISVRGACHEAAGRWRAN